MQEYFNLDIENNFNLISPKEIQSKIFQPFYTTKVVGKGTGLGLSLCNTIIENHRGEFSIDNESKNTCFVIKLPTRGNNNE